MSEERPKLVFRRPLPANVRALRHDHGPTIFDFVHDCPRCEAERALYLGNERREDPQSEE